MIIFLYGPDTYRARQKLQEIIEHYKKVHKSGLNLKYYDLAENNFEKFWEEIQQTSMFKEKKLLVLKNVFSNPEFKEKFLKYSENFIKRETIILIFEGGDISKKDPLFKFLKKNSQWQEFEFLEEAVLRSWIKKEFEKLGCQANLEVIEKLINFVGSDSWRLSKEIQKLVSYCQAGNVQTKDIEVLVKPKIETDIFKTIDAIGSKNKKQALVLLKKHLQKGDSPLYLLSMINYQFRNLLLVKSGQFAKLKLHPYVLRKSTAQARKFTLEELKKIYQKIFQTELKIKTGRLEPETALDLLIAEI